MIKQSHVFDISYASKGLAKIRQKLTKIAPKTQYISPPTSILKVLISAKHSYPLQQKLTFYYNKTILIRWIIQDISELNASTLNIDPSEMRILFCIMKMMELSLLIQCIEDEKTQKLEGTKIFDQRLEQARGETLKYSKSITSSKCMFISLNTEVLKEALLKKRDQLLKPNEYLSKFYYSDLNLVFINAMLNLRRFVRNVIQNIQILKEGNEQLNKLHALMLKIYYLSASSEQRIENYIQILYNDSLRPKRNETYIHYLFNQHGIQLMHKYLSQAPECQLKRDMTHISIFINNPINMRE